MTAIAPRMADPGSWGARLRRARALVWKESLQVIRDPSSIAIGVVLPMVLILLFGYGLSLDVRHVPLAIVVDASSDDAIALLAAFQLSPYFAPRVARSLPDAENLLLQHSVDGIVRIPADFAQRLASGHGTLQVLVHGADANRARIIGTYVQGAVAVWAAQRVAAAGVPATATVRVMPRLWFNAASESRYFLVPGLIVLVMTLIGSLLTAMVVAREWERGTFEALMVTPVRSGEILLGKTLPYFVLAMIGLGACVFAARVMFEVPLRGSAWVLLGASVLYVFVALGIGLLISSWVRNQLVASQLTLLATFMPALMLSGFLFDLRSMPLAVRWITAVLPARYYVALLQTVFLAGNVWSVIVPNALVLAGMAVALGLGSRAVMRKSLQ